MFKKFIYGLSEFYRCQERFIANPGCYATATELALIPLLQAQAIELDSLSMETRFDRAGKNPVSIQPFCSCDNYVTYKSASTIQRLKPVV